MELTLNAINQALKRPNNFGNYIDDGAYETHMPVTMQHRDSSILQQSNFAVISQDLLKRFPNQCYIKQCSDWLVGWTDQLFVQVFLKHKPQTLDNLTKAFKAACEWQERLEEYPVADEEDFSRREYEETLENIDNETPSCSKDAESSEIFSWLWNKGIYPGGDDSTWYDREEIMLACWHLGFVDNSEPWLEDWQEWLNEHEDERLKFEELLRHLDREEFEKTQLRML